jgi:hypothetical protein
MKITISLKTVRGKGAAGSASEHTRPATATKFRGN